MISTATESTRLISRQSSSDSARAPMSGSILFNIFNASPVSTYNQSYVQTSPAPAGCNQPRSLVRASPLRCSSISERRPRRSPSWPDLRDLLVRERSGACVLSCGSARAFAAFSLRRRQSTPKASITAHATRRGVLPGVTVEASSPALIEKTRSVVTGGTGQYAIVDLRPGTYTVTFTLPGFNTVRREGIELTGNFVASVSVEMRVGAVAETVTVSGEAPIVDVTNSRRQQTISGDDRRDSIEPSCISA